MLQTKQGFSVIEVLLASSIFVLLVTTVGSIIIVGQQSTGLAGMRARAALIAQEGIEAVRNMRDEAFSSVTAGTHGLLVQNNQWAFSGTEDVTDIFTRQIIVGDITNTTKAVTSTVRWQQSGQRQGVTTLTIHLTNWMEPVGQANNLQVDTSNASLAGGGRRVVGITLENIGDTDITIATMTLTWDNSNLIEAIYIGGNKVWSKTGPGTPLGKQPSGTELNIIDVNLSVGSGIVNIGRIDFDGNMNGSTITMLFTMIDSSTREATVSFAPDITPPAAVMDLAALNPSANSVDLTWTAPGDDVSTGTATSYDVRYATSPITDLTWAVATQATGEPLPSPAGSAESMTVTGLVPNTTYYFALRTSDEVPNTSALSNVPPATTLAGIQSCAEFCQSIGYSSGVCRRNTRQCTTNSEVHEPGGDQYCTGGPSADTCCCQP